MSTRMRLRAVWCVLCLALPWAMVPLARSQPANDSLPHAPAPQPDSELDRSLASPLGTMFTFLKAVNRALDETRSHDREQAWQIATECIDFPPRDRTIDSGTYEQQKRDAAERLFEVLDRIGEVRQQELPDAKEIADRKLQQFTYFPRRNELGHHEIQQKVGRSISERIAIVQVRAGVWKFSRRTVVGLGALHETMMQLPPAYQPPSTSQVLVGFGPTFQRTPYWGWLTLLGTIFLGLLSGKIASAMFRTASRRMKQRGWAVRGLALDDAASPVSLALLTFGLMIGLRFLHLEEPLADFSWKILLFLYILSLGWVLYNLVDVIELTLLSLTAKTETKLDDMVVPLIRKTLRIFLVVVLVLFVAQNVFGFNITGWLAGLGIAGLAVSLAAQDSVKNLFGSFTIFFDKPFLAGDFIHFDGDTGSVEEIGFRSTRIRLLSGHVVTVPNMKFIDNKVENIAARPYIRRQMDVTITYDTPPDKIEQAVGILKGLLHDGDVVDQGQFDMETFPPRVAFNELNADSLNIRAYYWYQMAGDPDRGFFTFLEHCQLVNMKLFRAFDQTGIEFAFPTQTLYLAGDPARQLRVEAEMVGGSGAVTPS